MRVFCVFRGSQRQKMFTWGNLCYLAFTVAICVSMAGAGDKGRLLSGGTGFYAVSGIKFLDLIFVLIGMATTVVLV